jgi:hypothetical protein
MKPYTRGRKVWIPTKLYQQKLLTTPKKEGSPNTDTPALTGSFHESIKRKEAKHATERKRHKHKSQSKPNVKLRKNPKTQHRKPYTFVGQIHRFDQSTAKISPSSIKKKALRLLF